MQITKMHLAFLNSLGKKGNNQRVANMVVNTLQTHARIQEAQQREKEKEAAERREALVKQAMRLETSLDAV